MKPIQELLRLGDECMMITVHSVYCLWITIQFFTCMVFNLPIPMSFSKVSNSLSSISGIPDVFLLDFPPDPKSMQTSASINNILSAMQTHWKTPLFIYKCFIIQCSHVLTHFKIWLHRSPFHYFSPKSLWSKPIIFSNFPSHDLK